MSHQEQTVQRPGGAERSFFQDQEGGQCVWRKVRQGEWSEQVREVTGARPGPCRVGRPWACAVNEQGALGEVGHRGTLI